mmetsp:Transcript_9748/g.15597  ORF Transcript_9748/g.15597 Transcript_9748/m.15597 type:complete len:352 (+) Transcript_9748:113-1168(+)
MDAHSEIVRGSQHPASPPFRETRISGGDEAVGQAIAGSCSIVTEASSSDFAIMEGAEKHIPQQRDARSATLVSIHEDEPLDEKHGMEGINGCEEESVIEWRTWALQVNTLLNDFHQKLGHLENRVVHLMNDWCLRKAHDDQNNQQNPVGRRAANPEEMFHALKESQRVVTTGKDWVPLNPDSYRRLSPRGEKEQRTQDPKDSSPVHKKASEGAVPGQRDESRSGRAKAGDQMGEEAASEDRRRWARPGFLRGPPFDEPPPADPPTKLLWAGSSCRAAQLLQTGVFANPLELESASRGSTRSKASQQERLSPANALKRLNSFLDDVGVAKVQTCKESSLLGSPAGSDKSETI